MPGQDVVAHGLFDDTIATGPILGLVLRKLLADKTYLVKGIDCENAYFRSFLDENTEFPMKLMQKPNEGNKKGKNGEDATLVNHWGIVAECDAEYLRHKHQLRKAGHTLFWAEIPVVRKHGSLPIFPMARERRGRPRNAGDNAINP